MKKAWFNNIVNLLIKFEYSVKLDTYIFHNCFVVHSQGTQIYIYRGQIFILSKENNLCFIIVQFQKIWGHPVFTSLKQFRSGVKSFLSFFWNGIYICVSLA